MTRDDFAALLWVAAILVALPVIWPGSMLFRLLFRRPSGRSFDHYLEVWVCDLGLGLAAWGLALTLWQAPW